MDRLMGSKYIYRFRKLYFYRVYSTQSLSIHEATGYSYGSAIEETLVQHFEEYNYKDQLSKNDSVYFN